MHVFINLLHLLLCMAVVIHGMLFVDSGFMTDPFSPKLHVVNIYRLQLYASCSNEGGRLRKAVSVKVAAAKIVGSGRACLYQSFQWLSF